MNKKIKYMATMDDIDAAWLNFCDSTIENDNDNDNSDPACDVVYDAPCDEKVKRPKCGSLYISTKTKISYLSHKINLADVFWKVPVIPYHLPREGVVKKQMKFNSLCEEELQRIHENIRNSCDEHSHHIDDQVITRIVNPEGRVKFKDVRKISIGLCKKDIISYRCKKKSAFYNCFVLIIRVLYENKYKEVHVKIFNTGKLEIPGIQTDDILNKVLDLLTDILRPHAETEEPLSYLKGKCETVLINSNFNCGYFINRDKMFDLLKLQYKINCSFDPCSYPGIQSEFYYDPSLTVQTGRQPADTLVERGTLTKISFMIFRTGSVLIVGKCTEPVLEEIYAFVRNLLEREYDNVGDALVDHSIAEEEKSKKRKIRKRKIIVSDSVPN
tara:strand:+ start:3017 stop:4171 length:1155 start_codon:yes stop_codon:yes gene_type:complete